MQKEPAVATTIPVLHIVEKHWIATLGKTRATQKDPRRHQYALAFSIRYDFNEHVLFKLEAHSIDGRYQTFDTVRIPNPTPSNHNTLIAVKTTLSF